jgi:hypothetical protein
VLSLSKKIHVPWNHIKKVDGSILDLQNVYFCYVIILILIGYQSYAFVLFGWVRVLTVDLMFASTTCMALRVGILAVSWT